MNNNIEFFWQQFSEFWKSRSRCSVAIVAKQFQLYCIAWLLDGANWKSSKCFGICYFGRARPNSELISANIEKFRLSRECEDQKQEMRHLKEKNSRLTEQLLGLHESYRQSNDRLNDRLYKEMSTRGDEKVWKFRKI